MSSCDRRGFWSTSVGYRSRLYYKRSSAGLVSCEALVSSEDINRLPGLTNLSIDIRTGNLACQSYFVPAILGNFQPFLMV